MAIEATSGPITRLADVEDLFPAVNPCENCFIPHPWTSPLTCLWLHASTTTPPETPMLLLVHLVHRWLTTLLDRNGQGILPSAKLLEERRNLRRRIELFEPAPRDSNEAEAMYECCRWASLILLTTEELSIPMCVAAKIVRIQPRLVTRLRTTNLSNFWGAHKGLLLWVVAICHVVTVNQCFPLLSTAMMARFAQEMAMSEYCSEIAIKPLKRLKQFESLCCYRDPRGPTSAIQGRAYRQFGVASDIVPA